MGELGDLLRTNKKFFGRNGVRAGIGFSVLCRFVILLSGARGREKINQNSVL